jgi:hypothetical protein
VSATETEDKTPETEDKKQKVMTNYVVLASENAKGPWDVLGDYSAHGQMAAKRQAAEEAGKEVAEKLYFIAVPLSSYVPQKPALKVTTQIAFTD